jgi:aminoglycoside N3'-acetyltransferase
MQDAIHFSINRLKAKLHYASKRMLSQRFRNRMKQWQISTRKEVPWFYILVHGRYRGADLVEQIRTRLPTEFEILMVHSAYDRLLPMYSGTSHEIVRGLIELCGPNRTLAMPAFVLGGRSYDVCQYYRKHHFDVRRTPSEMGLLTETFRRVPGVARSLHPTHSLCATGPLAGLLTADHHLAPTRAGQGTPFELMTKKRTVILGLGIEYYRCLTQMHTAEDLLGDAFPVSFKTEQVPVTIIASDGTRLTYDLHVRKTDRSMSNGVLRSLLSRTDLREWTYRGTALFMTFADRVTTCLTEAAKKGVTIYGGGHWCKKYE